MQNSINLQIELFNGGYFFRDLIDLLNAITPISCWLKFSQTSISITTIGEDDINIKWCSNININTMLTFSQYVLSSIQYGTNVHFGINIDPKKISKLCRNIKRTDKIQISFVGETNLNGKLVLTIFDDEKKEEKILPFNTISISEFDVEEKIEAPENAFASMGFDLKISEILNLKKAIGNKREIIDVYLSNNYLKFSTMGQFISPITIKFGNGGGEDDDDVKKTSFSGKILNILGKLNNLSKIITFKESLDENKNWLLISSILNYGTFNIYIMKK